MHLEDRAVPGSVMTRPDLSAALGSTLALSLDLTGNDAIAVASYEAQLQSQPSDTRVDQAAQPVAPAGNPDSLGLQDIQGVSALPVNDLNGDNGQIPPPPSHRQFINLSFLSGSFLQIGTQSPITFGDDSGSEGWNHVKINPSGKIVANPKHYNLPPYVAMVSGFTFNVQLEDLSKATGSYDRTTGNASASVTLDVFITSPDAPGFDNMNCKVPPTTLNFTTDNGTPFAMNPNNPNQEVGTMVDNTFAAPSIPLGACGNYQGVIDYAAVINGYFGLPSASGSNTFSLHVGITPAIGP